VCDGMGGAAAGEIASSLAVDEVMAQLVRRADAAPMPQLAEEAICAGNKAIYTRSSATQNSAAWAPRWWAWWWKNAACGYSTWATAAATGCAVASWSQLTQDHSLVEEQVRLDA